MAAGHHLFQGRFGRRPVRTAGTPQGLRALRAGLRWQCGVLRQRQRRGRQRRQRLLYGDVRDICGVGRGTAALRRTHGATRHGKMVVLVMLFWGLGLVETRKS